MAPASVPDDDPPTTTTPPRRSSSRVSFALADLPGLTPFAPAESPTALSRASSYVSFGSLWASRSGSLDKDDDDDAPDVEPPADEPPPVPLSEAERRGAAVEARRELVRQTLRDVRAAIARPSDEPSYRPPTLEGVLVLAILKSARSFVSAYGLRAGVACLLYLVQAVRTRRPTARGLRQALISPAPLRLALFLSSFTFLHSLVGHSLRLAPPAPYVRRRLLHSFALLRRSYAQSASLLEAFEDGLDALSLDCSFGPPPLEFDDALGERRWHAAASGAVAGGTAIYWLQAAGERHAIVEQSVVRALEGALRGASRALRWALPTGQALALVWCASQVWSAGLVGHLDGLKSLRSSIVEPAGAGGTSLESINALLLAADSAQRAVGAHLRDVARRTLTPENYPWLAGAVLALAAEARAPRSQLAVFVLPRALTAAYWAGAAHRSGRVPLEDGLLAAGAMAVLSDRVRWNDGRDLNPVVRRILHQYT